MGGLLEKVESVLGTGKYNNILTYQKIEMAPFGGVICQKEPQFLLKYL